MFTARISQEIKNGDGFFGSGRVVYFTTHEGQIKYEQYGNKIRRQVDSKGHTILMQYVKAVTFKSDSTGIDIVFELETNGAAWEGEYKWRQRIASIE